MTDRNLLEAAAKAGELSLIAGAPDDARGVFTTLGWWNPLTDDGDALRLAVKLDIWPYASSSARVGVWRILKDGRMLDTVGVDCWHGPEGRPSDSAHWEPTKDAATRRVIVLAAAAIAASK